MHTACGEETTDARTAGAVPKLSAGLVLYRVGPDEGVEVLLVHPGGPFWARRDAGAWSIPKGEYAPDEDPVPARRAGVRGRAGKRAT